MNEDEIRHCERMLIYEALATEIEGILEETVVGYAPIDRVRDVRDRVLNVVRPMPAKVGSSLGGIVIMYLS